MKKLILIALFVFIKQVHAQNIYTIAGNGGQGYSGDGGPATAANLYWPSGLAIDGMGNMFIADLNNNVIRMVNSAGIISTYAGNGTGAYSGDGGQASAAELFAPAALAFDVTGNMYIADQSNNAIRMINSAGIISTIATGFKGPSALAFDGTGNLYVADQFNNVIRKVNTAGIVSTVAGNYAQGYDGDGGDATDAELYYPSGLAFDAAGNMYIGDYYNNRIRKVNTAGIISTFAGNGTKGYSGDGANAKAAELTYPTAVAFDAAGNLYIADTDNNRIRQVNTDGIITTFAGNGTQGYSGDGGAATAAEFFYPCGLTFDGAGNLYIVEYYNKCVRMVNAPLPTLIASSASICVGNTATLTATGTTSYTWTATNTSAVYTGASIVVKPNYSTYYAITGPPDTTTFFGLTLVSNQTGGATVTVNPLPTIVIATNSSAICQGATATLTASGANTYTWNTGTIGDTINTSPMVTTNYSVTGTSSFGCINSANTTVTVNPVPSLTITASSYSLCAGASATLTASGAVVIYNWLPYADLNTNNGSTVIANPSTTTVYSVTGTTGSCSTVNTIKVTVNPSPSVPQLSNTSITYCKGQTYTPINATGTGIILWSNNPSMNPVIHIGNSFTPTNLLSGTTIYYLEDSSNTCNNPNTASVSVFVDSVPSASLQLVPDLIPHVWDLYIDYSTNVVNATWYWGDGTDTTGLYPSHGYAAAGMYNICVTVFNACGDSANYCQKDSLYRVATNTIIHVNVLNSQTTGIQQVTGNKEQIAIYPNPTQGILNVSCSIPNVTAHIYDINGKLVLSQAINVKTTIDASSLMDGVYNISISSNEGVINKRVVIVR